MDHGENKHCDELPYADKYYYKDNRACGSQDDPQRVEVYPPHRKYPELAFELPRQRYELEKVLRMLEAAYERGRRDQKAAISKLLKEVIGL